MKMRAIPPRGPCQATWDRLDLRNQECDETPRLGLIIVMRFDRGATRGEIDPNARRPKFWHWRS
jgi:hypothetical protein